MFRVRSVTRGVRPCDLYQQTPRARVTQDLHRRSRSLLLPNVTGLCLSLSFSLIQSLYARIAGRFNRLSDECLHRLFLFSCVLPSILPFTTTRRSRQTGLLCLTKRPPESFPLFDPMIFGEYPRSFYRPVQQTHPRPHFRFFFFILLSCTVIRVRVSRPYNNERSAHA